MAHHTRFSPMLAASTAVAMAALLAACSPDTITGDGPEQVPDVADSADTDTDTGTDAQGDSPAGMGLNTLYAESLHDGVDVAPAGTAYIDVEGERLDFSGIGWGDVGFDYEEELVQVSHLGGTGGRGEYSDISMAQNSGDEDGGIDWSRGDGPDPMVRIVGSDVTAIGTLEGHPGSEDPLEGTFAMAANCN